IAVKWMRLLPPAGCWGRVSWNTFKELFAYALDIFLIAVGQILINSSQVMVISRTLGLEAAAVWNVATRTFTLTQQVVARILDFSFAAFSEMMVRGERDKLLSRFRDVVTLTGSAAVLAALSVSVCNRSFLELWTHGRISWPVQNDLLMGVLVICYS